MALFHLEISLALSGGFSLSPNISYVSGLSATTEISIGNSMICSDIWHKYHEWYFEIVLRNFTSR